MSGQSSFLEFPRRCAFDRLGPRNLSLISSGAPGRTQKKPVASRRLCLPFDVYYIHTRMLTHSVNTHANTQPDEGKTNLVRTRAIGLSPLKGDSEADPPSGWPAETRRNISWENTLPLKSRSADVLVKIQRRQH